MNGGVVVFKTKPQGAALSIPGGMLIGAVPAGTQPRRTAMANEPATSWHGLLSVHRAAADFPRLPPDELKALAEDIKKNGQRQSIAIIERARRRPDGTFHISDPPLQEVLDGISRLDAMEAAGIAVTGADGQLDKQVLRTVVDTDEVDPVAYVISANIHRRHLAAEQKTNLLAKLVAAHPEKSDRQLAKETGVTHPTIAKARRKAEATGKATRLVTEVGRDQVEAVLRALDLPVEPAFPPAA
jgi:hypothetical protein